MSLFILNAPASQLINLSDLGPDVKYLCYQFPIGGS